MTDFRSLDVGTVIAHYRVIRPLGAGGMGEVYLAHDTRLDRDVALKVLPAEALGDATARARLIREARLASALNHSNICTIHEVGEESGRAYIAMEWIEGRTLDQAIPAHGLPAESVARIGAAIAAALAHAHRQGIVHRDLKGSNVMIGADGRVKVMDFGLARRPQVEGRGPATGATQLTSTGVVVGSPQYMAPEVLRGGVADARSDLWALGVVLHEMCTGSLPFQGQSTIELGAAILNSDPTPLPAGVPAHLRTVVQRCLAKDPSQRFQLAEEVRAVLETAMSAGGAPVLDAPRAAAEFEKPASKQSDLAAAHARARRRTFRIGAAIAIVIGALGIVVALDLGGAGRYFRGGADASHIRSLAVLPLENLSRDPEQEYFADGMTEELITSLAGLEGVRVISRTSVMRYKGTRKDLPQIARELGVDGVIEGSAMRVGDRVRISAQLIEAAHDRHLWARSYERDMRDVLALQGDVAQAIAGEIRASLKTRGRSETAPGRVVNPAAYDNYLQGRFYWNKRNPAALRQAIHHFERALQIDPLCAPAHAGLAEVYAVLADYIGALAKESPPRARSEAARALELDPQLAGPHAVLAIVKVMQDYDWSGAESEFRQALSLDPHNISALHWHAIMLSCTGQADEALGEIDRALSVDPLGLIVRNTRGRILASQRRWDEAMAEYRRVLELDSTFAVTYITMALVDEAQGRFAVAVARNRTADSLSGLDLDGYDALRRAAGDPDPRTYWRQQLAFLRDAKHRDLVSQSLMARCHARLGEKDLALAMLRQGEDERDPAFLDVIREWGVDPLRSDPRYAALMRRIGLEP